ncbi:MAG TPA: response regulator transcription factor [Caulobacteraceae bacterium]
MTVSSWPRSVMIVEDDAVIGELLSLRLAAAGLEPIWIKDGAMALAKIDQIRPTLMLLDLGLPVLDGFMVLESLRRHFWFETLPVIVMTARHSATDVKRAIQLGATDYVAKPFEMSDLLNRVRMHLGAKPRKVDWLSRGP